MQNPILIVNHIGYEPSSTKKVILQTPENLNPDIFFIKNPDNEILFTGKFVHGGKTDGWHTGYAFNGDFSEFKSTGNYQISCHIENQEIKSTWFGIEKNIVQKSCLPLLLKGFQSRHPEEKYEEKDKQISFFGDRDDQVDVQGGWYDASGDVSKYLTHLSFSNFMNPQQIPLEVWTILEAA